ncbi:hypothetical protein [Sphingopyxis sp.]|uniref:hypothetical protein n=1 Tax=Sphingopyxis sp. TaxID=1908224 RepID=UPI003F6EE19B
MNPFMPGLRVREDGFTAARTRVFLATLAKTGCVTDAARVAGVSRTSVNRSRALFAPFDAACREALAKALRGLEAVAYQRAVEGRETVVIRGGREVERRIAPSDALLALLIKRGELGAGTSGGAAAETAAEAARFDAATAITRAEYLEGWRFDVDGTKYFYPGSAKQRLRDKLHAMRTAMQADEWAQEEATGECMRCGARAHGAALERLAALRAKDAASEAEFAAGDDLPVD